MFSGFEISVLQDSQMAKSGVKGILICDFTSEKTIVKSVKVSIFTSSIVVEVIMETLGFCNIICCKKCFAFSSNAFI